MKVVLYGWQQVVESALPWHTAMLDLSNALGNLGELMARLHQVILQYFKAAHACASPVILPV